MKIAVLSANLGGFDNVVHSVPQNIPVASHVWTDEDFPPIAGLTPRLQYRIPKMFSWQMFPGCDYYIWLDGSMSLQKEDSVKWMLEQLGDGDIAFFKHPWRHTIKEETDHVEEYLQKKNKYITSRYANGLHKEQLADIQLDKDYIDDVLYASMTFIYRDSEALRDAMRLWWLHTSRYFTVDQIALPYAIKDLDVRILGDDPFKCEYVSLTSKHH